MSSRLPDPLFAAIEARLHLAPLRMLKSGYADLSRGYRQATVSEAEREDIEGLPEAGGHAPGGYTRAQARGLAYLAARFPATFAAAQAALRQLPDEALKDCASVLDLGAGPGTATWAFIERWPALVKASFLESDPEMLGHAQALAAAYPHLTVALHSGDLNAKLDQAPQHDIVVMAYVLSELDEAHQQALLAKAWAKADKGLLLLEPGTPDTSRRVLAARKQLKGLGGAIVAPCPQDVSCPLENAGQVHWCHFSVRLERRGLHKGVKGGDLGYEDEKFSWLFVSKQPGAGPCSPFRLHSDPHRVNRHIVLDVCDQAGKRRELFYSRRETPYKIRHAARKLGWGDGWDPATVPEVEGGESPD